VDKKGFLRPDWKKIVTTIALGGIIYFFTNLAIKIGVTFTFFVDIPNTQIVYPIIIIANVFYWYLLSCLIFLAYGKKFKRVKKKPIKPTLKRRKIIIPNWKGFLKPDKRKIVLTIILLIITGVGYFIPSDYSRLISIFLNFPLLIFNYVLGPQLESLLTTAEEMKSIPLVLLVAVISVGILVIYFYLLSCLITWVYDKVKKQEKKTQRKKRK
jgi:hypothetical protein